MLLDQFHAVLLQVAQDPVQLDLVGRGHPEDGQRMVVLLPAHLEAEDAVLATALEDVVEHLRQQERIDDVSFELDVLVGAHRSLVLRAGLAIDASGSIRCRDRRRSTSMVLVTREVGRAVGPASVLCTPGSTLVGSRC